MNRLRSLGLLALVVLLLPLLLAYVAAYLLLLGLWGLVLRVWFWRAHAARGRPCLFVYSESPNWQTYVEENLLPRLGERAVVLNWSERRLWDTTSPWEARAGHGARGESDQAGLEALLLLHHELAHLEPVHAHLADREPLETTLLQRERPNRDPPHGQRADGHRTDRQRPDPLKQIACARLGSASS